MWGKYVSHSITDPSKGAVCASGSVWASALRIQSSLVTLKGVGSVGLRRCGVGCRLKGLGCKRWSPQNPCPRHVFCAFLTTSAGEKVM